MPQVVSVLAVLWVCRFQSPTVDNIFS